MQTDLAKYKRIEQRGHVGNGCLGLFRESREYHLHVICDVARHILWDRLGYGNRCTVAVQIVVTSVHCCVR